MSMSSFVRATALVAGLSVALLTGGSAAAGDPNPCNPCTGKKANPCNPCGGKSMNPCNPCGGSARVDPAKFTRPAGLRMGGDRTRLVDQGKKLWSDTSLGTNGLACASCHQSYGAFLDTFATPYPHEVAMVKNMSGVGQIDAAEMVQFCMLQPMQADPLPWNSSKLAALAAYVEYLQADFEPRGAGTKAANPCNPCGGKRMNPCNPCDGKNSRNR